MIRIGEIDWRFADPFPDALVGINFTRLVSSPLARKLIVKLGARKGIGEAEVNKILDEMSDVNHVAVSFRDNQAAVMITGRAADESFPPPEAGLKVATVSAGAMLVGHEDAVNQAMQRIASRSALMDSAKLAEERQASSEFWALGSSSLFGPEAMSQGLKGFSLTVSIRNTFASDLALEFYRAPDANTLRTWQMTLGAAALEGNALHLRTSMEAVEVEQKFDALTAGPIGEALGALLQATRYLPARQSPVPNGAKPVIYGLDGGPRVVNQ